MHKGLLLGQVLEEEKELYSSGWTCLGLWPPHTVLAWAPFLLLYLGRTRWESHSGLTLH